MGRSKGFVHGRSFPHWNRNRFPCLRRFRRAAEPEEPLPLFPSRRFRICFNLPLENGAAPLDALVNYFAGTGIGLTTARHVLRVSERTT
jgi:hypothetical protein